MNGLKVALIVPKSNILLPNYAPPLNLAYIASYLKKMMPETEIRIIDEPIGDDVESNISEFRPDVVGVTASTPQAPQAYRIGDMIRQNWPDILSVIGGIHATVKPEEAWNHFDVVVVGEGEKTFFNIVQSFQNKKRLYGIFRGEPIEDLDDLPSPSFNLIKMNFYLGKSEMPNLQTPLISLVTSRGCPHRCAFCWNSFRQTKVRYFSAKRVAEEILFLRKKYGINSVFFHDDAFLINHQRIEELCVLFREFGISEWLKWGCQVRATTVTLRLLKTIKKMGCVYLSVGLESGSERILKYLKSGSATLATNQKALKIGGRSGITMGGTFIVGTPTETMDEMKQTLDWAINHPELKQMGVFVLAPYPGTKIWRFCMERGLLPKKVNYEHLIPKFMPEETYLVTNVPRRTFNHFMKETARISWFINQVRYKPSIKKFILTLGHPTGYMLLAKHPKMVVKELSNLIHARFSDLGG